MHDLAHLLHRPGQLLQRSKVDPPPRPPIHQQLPELLLPPPLLHKLNLKAKVLVSSGRWPVLLRKFSCHSSLATVRTTWLCTAFGKYLLTKIYNRGVAVGSSIGHAIGGFFGGGSSAPAEQQSSAVAAQGQTQDQNSWGSRNCEVDAKQFTKCLDDNQGNMQICNWYLEQLVCARYIWFKWL